MTVRLVRAVIDALGDDSPMLLIGIGEREMSLSWDEDRESGPPETENDDLHTRYERTPRCTRPVR